MTGQTKIRPEINGRGVFFPWAAVVSGLGALIVVALIPLWIFAANAVHVANNVDLLIKDNKEIRAEMSASKERIAKLEGRNP